MGRSHSKPMPAEASEPAPIPASTASESHIKVTKVYGCGHLITPVSFRHDGRIVVAHSTVVTKQKYMGEYCWSCPPAKRA